MLMRVLKFGTIITTVFTAVIFAVIYVMTTVTKDKTYPEISVPDTMLEVSVSATEDELMRDVSAYDAKDGDISNRLLVESISRFSETGYCKITYAVCDYDNHVVTATRQLHYTDYTHPKFTLSRSPIFSIYNEIDTNGLIGAVDCIDGDISQNVIIYSPDFQEDEEGTFTIEATVTNSKGDIVEISLPLIVEKMSRNAPEIVLDSYLIYVKKGDKAPDWKSHIKETLDSTGIDAALDVTIKTNLDMHKAGVYLVNFYITDELGMTGHTAMTVVVE